MSQTTLRQIPAALDRRLRDLARRSGSSLNKTIIAILLKALGIDEGGGKKRDLRRLAGTWNEEQANEFEKNTRVFEDIDPEIWAP
jgi:hypothetical protein